MAKPNRKGNPIPAIQTRAEMESVLATVRRHTLERNRLQLVQQTRQQMVADQCAPALAQVNELIEEEVQRLRQWAKTNAPEFGPLKSLALPQGSLGWRLGNLTLKPQRGYSWDDVLAKLKRRPRFAGYVRTTEEVNKAALLVDRETIPPGELQAVGLRWMQEEKFFVDPNLTETENRQTE